MKPIKFKSQWGKVYNIIFCKSRYANNKRLYIGCLCEEEYGEYEPYCDVTVNLAQRIPDGNYGFLDTNNADPMLLNLMYAKGWIEDTEMSGFSGFCIYPLVKFTDEFLEMIQEGK